MPWLGFIKTQDKNGLEVFAFVGSSEEDEEGDKKEIREAVRANLRRSTTVGVGEGFVLKGERILFLSDMEACPECGKDGKEGCVLCKGEGLVRRKVTPHPDE